MNDIKDNLGTQQHIVVPKPQDTISTGCQILSASGIVRSLVLMLTAIGFDDYSGLEADKIHYVASDQLLTPKLAIGQPTVAQMSPEAPLGIGTCYPQISCARSAFGSHAVLHLFASML